MVVAVSSSFQCLLFLACNLCWALWDCLHGCQQLVESDSMKHVCSHTVHDRESDVRTVLRRVDVHAKWTLAERHVDDSRNCISNCCGIGVGRYDRRERLHDLVFIVGVWSSFVLCYSCVVRRST